MSALKRLGSAVSLPRKGRGTGYHLLDWPVSSEPSIHHLKVRVVPAAALAIQGEENTHYIWEHSNPQPRLSARGFPMREVIARGMTPFLGSLVPVWEILDHVSMR